MKLKEGFVLHKTGDEYLVVATGDALEKLNGYIRNNETAQYMFQLLTQDTTEEALIDALFERYDAPREVIAADVHSVIEQLLKAGVLDE